jgi:hypothetical protein
MSQIWDERSVKYKNWNNEEIEFILDYVWIEKWDGRNDEPSYDGYIDEYEIYLEIEGKRVDFSEMLSDDVINSILQSAEYDIRNEL